MQTFTPMTRVESHYAAFHDVEIIPSYCTPTTAGDLGAHFLRTLMNAADAYSHEYVGCRNAKRVAEFYYRTAR